MSTSASSPQSLAEEMEAIGQRARAAAGVLACSPWTVRSRAISLFATILSSATHDLLAANHLDLEEATARALGPAMTDRLRLDEHRVADICAAIEATSKLPDPLGKVLAQWDTDNGLHFERVSVPLGVIAVIFESRYIYIIYQYITYQ
jgi:glutamate-5-semialdehyde dehydrogenase